VWPDTPDYYTTATEDRFWSEVHADSVVLATAGYLGGGGWSGSTEDAFSRTHPRGIPAAADVFGLGLRLRLVGYPTTALPLLAPVDDAGVRQVEVRIDTDGIVKVFRGSTELGASALPLPTYTDIKFGFRGRVSATVGEVEVLVAHSGMPIFTPIIRLTGVNTAEAGTALWTGFYLGRPPAWVTSHAYAGHGDGGLRPGYLVLTLRPDTLDVSQWAPSVTTVPGDIDDLTPDDDASFIYANAVRDRYLVHPEAMDPVKTIYGVRTVALVRNFGGQTVTHGMAVSDGLNTRVSPWQSVSDSAWVGVDRFDRVHPVTGEAWTPTSVVASSYGGEVAA
jgi:hypothetical protein